MDPSKQSALDVSIARLSQSVAAQSLNHHSITRSISAVTQPTLDFTPALQSLNGTINQSIDAPAVFAQIDHQLQVDQAIKQSIDDAINQSGSFNKAGLPISLPLPLLSSLNADSQSINQSISKLPAHQLIGRKNRWVDQSIELIDQFLPPWIQAKSKENLDHSITQSIESEQTNNDQPIIQSIIQCPSSHGLSCAQFGQHICVWRWRGLVLLQLVVCVIICCMIPAFSYYDRINQTNEQSSSYLTVYSFYSRLYTALVTINLSIMLAPRFLSNEEHRPVIDPLIDYYPVIFSYALFGLIVLHSLIQPSGSPTINSVLIVCGCCFIVNLSTFMNGFRFGLRIYCLSLILFAAAWLKAFVQLVNHSSNQPIDYEERFIILGPFFLTLFSGLSFTMEHWFRHCLSLLTRALAINQSIKQSALSASKLKSDFLSSVSHDLRTPMNAILGFIQLSLLDRSLVDETRECLSTAYTSAEDLLVLLNDVLDIAKIESGHLRFEEISFELASVFEKSARTFAASAQAKGVELIVDFDPGLQQPLYQTMIGDPSRLTQIINNLLSNAVKFTGGDSNNEHSPLKTHNEIVMRVSLLPSIQPGYVHILTSVADSGEGISAAGLARIFKPFTQADSTISRRHGGSGLGLTISAELVKRSGGRIWAQSTQGKGSVFNFTAQFKMKEPITPSIANITPSNQSLTEAVLPEVKQVDPITETVVTETSTVHAPSCELSHTRSAPLPTRQLIAAHLTPRANQLRVLLAVHNPINAQVLARAIAYWANREFASCSASTPCNKCKNRFTWDQQHINQASTDANNNQTTPQSPPHTIDQSINLSINLSLDGTALEEPSVAGRLAATPHSSLSSQSINHSTFFELIPSSRLTSEHVYRELQWARTTRQPYDLIVLDESAPKLDTVKVLVAMNKRKASNQPLHHSNSEQSLGQFGKQPAVLILTTRLLSPILRGNGVSTYVLISKPVLLPDLSRALTLLLKEQNSGINQAVNQSHSMPVVGRRLAPSHAARMQALNHQDLTQNELEDQMDSATINSTVSQPTKPYVSSSRRPKEENDNQTPQPQTTIPSINLQLLHEPVRLHQIDRRDHISSEPASPVEPAQSTISSRRPVNHTVDSAQVGQDDKDSNMLPESQAEVYWSGRAQSMPDFVRYDPLSSRAAIPVDPAQTTPSNITKPRSKSVHTVFFPFDATLSPSPSDSEPANNAAISTHENSLLKAYRDSKDHTASPSSHRSPRESFSSLDPPQHSPLLIPSQSPVQHDATFIDKHLQDSSEYETWAASPPRSLSSGSAHTVKPLAKRPPRRVLPSNKVGCDSTGSPHSPSLSHQVHSGPTTRSNSSASSTCSSTSASPSVYSPLTSNSVSPLVPLNKQSMSAPSRVRSASPYQVLVVDDNAINLKVVSKMLTRLGYDCITSKSGQDAINRIEKQKAEYTQAKPQEYPEFIRGRSAESDMRTQSLNQNTPDRSNPNHWIVLMDIQMDGMNGHEATRQLRKLGHVMPIVALTGNCTAEDRELCIQSGMQGFLGKPLLMESLEKALKEAIDTIQQKWEQERANHTIILN